MLSIRSWIRRHKRSLIVSAGLVGVGYVCYKTVKSHYKTSQEKETHTYLLRQAEQRVEAQLQLHFQSVQRISDTATLPFVLPQLKTQLLNQLNLSALTEKLVQGKEVPRVLSGKEKIELWQELKILSFTLAVTSVWALVLLVLFVRIQLNVLARHLYIDTARDIAIADKVDCTSGISSNVQEKYVAFTEFFPNKGLEILISDTKKAVEHVLASLKKIYLRPIQCILSMFSLGMRGNKENLTAVWDIMKNSRTFKSLTSKPLREPCSLIDLRDIFLHIANVFEEGKSKWIVYMLPNNNVLPDELSPTPVASDMWQLETKLTHDNEKVLSNLVDETRGILESVEFHKVLTTSFRALLDLVVENFREIYKGGDIDTIPFAKLIPPVSTIEALVLDQPTENTFIQQLTNLPEFQSFVATVYSAGN